jgi:hypothetical protein
MSNIRDQPEHYYGLMASTVKRIAVLCPLSCIWYYSVEIVPAEWIRIAVTSCGGGEEGQSAGADS